MFSACQLLLYVFRYRCVKQRCVYQGQQRFPGGGGGQPQMRSKLIQQLMDMGFKVSAHFTWLALFFYSEGSEPGLSSL